MNRKSGQHTRTQFPELRWAYLVFGLLLVIDILIGFRIFKRLLRHEGEISPDAPIFLLAILALKFLLVWLYVRLRDTLHTYQRLREMHEQELDFTRQLLDASTEGMMVFGPEGRVLYANRRAAEILGHSMESLLGRGPLDIIEATDQAEIRAQVQQSWSAPQQHYSFRVLDAAGQVRRVRITASPRWHHGRIVGSFGVLHPADLPPASQD